MKGFNIHVRGSDAWDERKSRRVYAERLLVPPDLADGQSGCAWYLLVEDDTGSLTAVNAHSCVPCHDRQCSLEDCGVRQPGQTWP